MLDEIQADEEHKADQQFYGDIAYTEWLASRKLKPGSTGPQGRSRPKSTSDKASPVSRGSKTEEPAVRSAPKNESLHKTNSVQPESQASAPAGAVRPKAVGQQLQQPAEVKGAVRPSPIPEKQENSNRFPERNTELAGWRGSPGRRGVTPIRATSSEMSTGANEGPGQAEPTTAASPGHYEGFYNEKDWNKSTKIPPKSYTTILTDHYPRDEYTMLPKDPPKRAVREPTDLQEVERQVPKVPKDVVAKTMHPNLYERPVVHKCKHIADIHKKYHPLYETLPKAEAGIHLTNDPSSRLFQDALLPPNRPAMRLRTPSTAMSSVSSWSGSNVTLRSGKSNLSLANIMQRMSKPTQYPRIMGRENDLNLGQVTAI